jgi:hypothetical protein
VTLTHSQDRLLSIDELDRDIVNLSSRINVATQLIQAILVKLSRIASVRTVYDAPLQPFRKPPKS